VLSDEIERIFRRDLDQLPGIPENRWIPSADPQRSHRSPAVLASGLGVAVLLALAVGTSLSYLPDLVTGAVSASARPTMPPSNSGQSEPVVSRQFVLAHVRDLTTVGAQAVRFEAKLVAPGDLGGRPLTATSAPASASGLLRATSADTLLWVVAIRADARCSFCVLPSAHDFNSALFWVDARTGSVIASAQSIANWPDGFDELPDRSLSLGSTTLVGQILNVTDDVLHFQQSGSAVSIRLRPDANTAYMWRAGPTRGAALTFAELPRRWDLVSVIFDSVAQGDGTYRLEEMIAVWDAN
jgi:hypothetical protein